MTESAYQSLRKQLAGFDPAGVTAGIAALQLLPENGDHLLRLEVLADLASTLPNTGPSAEMSRRRWEQLVSGQPLMSSGILEMEDWFDSEFTSELAFYGGPHLVLPGLTEDAVFVGRLLFRALHIHGGFPESRFAVAAARLAQAALTLSDAVVRRAGLQRGAPAVHRDRRAVLIPSAQVFAKLKGAARFSHEELAALLEQRGLSTTDLGLLTQDIGSSPETPSDLSTLKIFKQPILRTPTHFIVSVPGGILAAVRHAIIVLALTWGVEKELSRRLRIATLESISQSLRLLRHRPNGRLQLDAGDPRIEHRIYGFDVDKVLHVMLVSDPLTGYEKEHMFGQWETGDLASTVERSIHASEELLFGATPAPNDILHLVIVQGVGRGYALGLAGPAEPANSHRLLMDAADLETIALLEVGDPLALWKYACACDKLRDTTHVMRFDELDEYQIYRHNSHSFYLSDDRRPTLLNIAPGSGERTHLDVRAKYDVHTVPHFRRGSFVEVALLSGETWIPIYVQRDTPDRLAQYVELDSNPIWVVAPASPEPRHWYAQFVELVAYWLWQLVPELEARVPHLAEPSRAVVVTIELEPGPGWADSRQSGSSTPFSVDIVDSRTIHLLLRSSILRTLVGSDNSGERELMRAVLAHFHHIVRADAGGDSDSVVDEVLERKAPRGNKKKLLLFLDDVPYHLDDRGLPPHRDTQDADISDVLDDVGSLLAIDAPISSGRIPEDHRTSLLQKVVGGLFVQLAESVATLNGSGLLEWLVLQNERLLNQQSVRELTVPTRLACYASVPHMVQQLKAELPELYGAGIASRFLIEYVTACPPNGLRPMSLAAYDRLMAIASEIFHWAVTSDLIHYGLADLPLSMLPSGRLGTDRREYEAVRDEFMEVHAGAELSRASERFDLNWTSYRGGADLKAADVAAVAEFGVTLSEQLAFLGEIINLGLSADRSPSVFELDTFLDTLGRNLAWSEPKTQAMASLFFLERRDEFLSPPASHRREDVYPWRFNRSLSYLRRPLLIRGTGGKPQVIFGVRNVRLAGSYLLDLVMGGRLSLPFNP
jgi:hypothetical protein